MKGRALIAAVGAALLVTLAWSVAGAGGGALTAAPAAAAPSVCLGDPTAAGVRRKPGPRLRFGITPAGVAGAAGPAVPVTPIRRRATLAALARLRPRHAPFVLRLNRLFWSDGERGIRRFLAQADRYTSRGYLVELQVRYHPRPDQEGHIGAFADYVREVVRRFGRNRRVVAVQVTNEVNFYPIAPDASDSGYDKAKKALIRGVIAAKDEARRRHYRQLAVGFNWAYRTDPQREDAFWSYLGDHGGRAFRDAVDWVGLDAYPGTVFPPAEPPGGTRDGMVAAMSQLRKCFMPKAGLGRRVPIHVEENGWPTGDGRTEAQQELELRAMVGAVDDFRGTYHVTDYRWFDLRDHNTSSPNFQHHYGLLRDDYSPKPAFDAYRQLMRKRAGRG